MLWVFWFIPARSCCSKWIIVVLDVILLVIGIRWCRTIWLCLNSFRYDAISGTLITLINNLWLTLFRLMYLLHQILNEMLANPFRILTIYRGPIRLDHLVGMIAKVVPGYSLLLIAFAVGICIYLSWCMSFRTPICSIRKILLKDLID